MLKMTIKGNGIVKLQDVVEALGSESKAHRAYAMGLNRAMKAARTQVKKVVAKQMGVTQSSVMREMSFSPASGKRLYATLKAHGAHLGTSRFNAKQRKSGLSARPWGKQHLFPRAFLVPSLSGQAFHRTGGFSKASGRVNAIKKHYGPALPKEIVKDKSAEAFEKIASERFPKEIADAITALTNGYVR